ncbi:MAG: RNA-directed DNA polymerase [Nostoc sp.]|uniref:RNA-directed DNA polymerase n=1 Tax=Nostoc sp. TaxID=1180 RepID=UPI002FF3AE2F
MIEIRVDISKFYPSIYTHSVTWGFLGKEKAKNYFNQRDRLDILIASGDIDAKLYEIADDIDNCIISCQERQSIGIPIGPDTSHIIAELIACRIEIFFKLNLQASILKRVGTMMIITCLYLLKTKQIEF